MPGNVTCNHACVTLHGHVELHSIYWIGWLILSKPKNENALRMPARMPARGVSWHPACFARVVGSLGLP